jgi:hypothetical protein
MRNSYDSNAEIAINQSYPSLFKNENAFAFNFFTQLELGRRFHRKRAAAPIALLPCERQNRVKVAIAQPANPTFPMAMP